MAEDEKTEAMDLLNQQLQTERELVELYEETALSS